MNKNLHDIDNLFRSGLEGYEETPSAGVKEALYAALDKKEAAKYKRRFIVWKKTAQSLLLLLAVLVLYESISIKNRKFSPAAKNAPLVDSEGSRIENKINNPMQNAPDTLNGYKVPGNNLMAQTDNVEDQQRREQITTVPESPLIANIIRLNKTSLQKNSDLNERGSINIKKQNPLFLTISSQHDKRRNSLSNNIAGLKKITPDRETFNDKTSTSNLSGQLFKNISMPPPMRFSNPPAAGNPAKDSKKKKINSFKPFWMATAFSSYEQAGYRLDSDEPSAITSIRFREANEPSFSAGVLLGLQLTPRVSLQSGIVYRKNAIGMRPQKTYAFVDPTGQVAFKYITSSGYAYIKPGFGPQPSVGDSLTTAEAKHTLEYLSVPLIAGYTLASKKISITPGVGVEANFITKANLEVDIEDPFNREIVIVRKLNGIKSFYCSFIADTEIKYNLTKNVSININAVYRTALSPITKNNTVETFPHSFGIGAGLTIKF